MIFLCRPLHGADAFEILSIKPHTGNGSGGEPSSLEILPGGRLHGSNVSVRKLLRAAFLTDDANLTGIPAWADSETYDLEAATAGHAPLTSDNAPGLLLAALEDRFRLRYSKQSREKNGLALTAAKDKVKLKPSAPDAKPTMSVNTGNGLVDFHAAALSMTDFARVLERQLSRPVVDRTELPGTFDADLTWSKEVSAESAAPSLEKVLQEAGFRLSGTRIQVEVISIDHLERASEN